MVYHNPLLALAYAIFPAYDLSRIPWARVASSPAAGSFETTS